MLRVLAALVLPPVLGPFTGMVLVEEYLNISEFRMQSLQPVNSGFGTHRFGPILFVQTYCCSCSGAVSAMHFRFHSSSNNPTAAKTIATALSKNQDWNQTYPQSSRDATKVGSECVSLQQLMGKEDCLFMNVWSPFTSASAMAPVLLFVHGKLGSSTTT